MRGGLEGDRWRRGRGELDGGGEVEGDVSGIVEKERGLGMDTER